jgi:hypothetical protein
MDWVGRGIEKPCGEKMNILGAADVRVLVRT